MTTRLMRVSEVTKLTGVRRETIHNRVKCGTFPAPKKIGRSIVWLEADLIAWMQSLPTATYAKKGV